MKAILYVSLTANGYFAQLDESHPIPKEVLGNFIQHVGKSGNLIIGKHTYDLMRNQIQGFQGIDLVVVSRSLQQPKGILVAKSPTEALKLLEQKGKETALVGGGAELDSAFLSQGLVDEIYVNIEPLMVNKGVTLAVNELSETSLELMNSTELSRNTVQIHYQIKK